MLSIFNRKKYLIDLLEGFVDMHNHILPGIDDGAKTVEESIELVKSFADFGVQDFIATPHIMHNYYPNDSETIGKSLALLQNGLKMNDLKEVSIEGAAEHMIDANFETLLENGDVMPMQKNYLLVEMSYLQASINFDEAIRKIAEKRFFPILAHPERYVFFQNRMKKYKELKDKGILFQLNMLSISEYYGKEVQQTALKLLEEGLINFIATDVHNMSQLNSIKQIKLSKKLLNMLEPLVETTTYNFN